MKLTLFLNQNAKCYKKNDDNLELIDTIKYMQIIHFGLVRKKNKK